LSESPNFQLSSYEICHSSLIVLQKQKTQKLIKTLENNKAKGLTSAIQGVQIHNIWHSSVFPSERSSVSNIRPDDENFPSERQSVSRNFKLFKNASVRMPFSFRHAIGFLSQTQIWEDSCKPSRRCGVPVRKLSFARQVMQQKCNRPNEPLKASGRPVVSYR
jgi:hypothetical protein